MAGVLGRSWKSERPLVFAHVFLIKVLGICRAKDIQARSTRQMDIWERGLRAGLVRDAQVEGATKEGRAASGGDEEEKAVARSYHDTVLSGMLRKDVRQAANMEEGGFLLPHDQCTKTGRIIAEVLWEKNLDMRVPLVEKPVCTAFEKYGEVPKTVPLNFTEDDVMWVASKLSGAAGALGAEAIELRNWILCFGCASEELRDDVSRLAEWMASSSPPRAAYCALRACCLVALDKSPGLRPNGKRETLCRALIKLNMRAAGDQVNMVCGNLHLCAGLEAGIEG